MGLIYLDRKLAAVALFVVIMLWASALAAQSKAMCAAQPPMTEKELKSCIKVMEGIIAKNGQMNPDEEEQFIKKNGLDPDRMNCVLGKLLAANDIFGWGAPEAYGVDITKEELDMSRKHKKASSTLKQYLDKVLNIKVED